MIDRNEKKLSISKQCQLLRVNRSSFYNEPQPIKAQDLELMRLIDEQYMKTPTCGSRSMRNYLRRLGYKVNRKRIQRLMRLMGLEAIYPKPHTSRPHPQHKIYPYLLKNITIDRSNQAWATDITYIAMARGFMYLVAVMDWHSRKVLSFKLSNTLDTDFCVEALNQALDHYGPPQIFNTDQGAQFTSKEFTDTLKSAGVAISMDGRGRATDNIFIERLWWSVKYHYLYLHTFDTGRQLRNGLAHWFGYYNSQRAHQGLDDMTPDEVYFGCCSIAEAA